MALARAATLGYSRRVKTRTLAWGLLAIAGLGCGLSFGDLGATAGGDAGPLASATGTVTARPTGTPTDPTPVDPPDGGPGDAEVDALSLLDAGADASGDARPPPTNVPPRIVLRFELNFLCQFAFNSPTCTRNEGTFTQRAVYRGASSDFANTPGGAFGPQLNFWRARMGGPSANAIDIDDATDAVPAGVPVERLTVAAWVRRSSETGAERDNLRIVSMGPVGGMPMFEFGFNKGSETSLMASVGQALPGKKGSLRNYLLEDEWTFVAMTYEPTADLEMCFYRGTEATEVTLMECVDYPGRSFSRAQTRFTVGNAAATATRDGAKKVSFPGFIDNVFVYFGDALDIEEMKKLQRD